MLEKFPEHENSEVHRESIAKLAAKNSGQSIASALNRQHDEETKFHREMLLKLLSCIRFLARQGLPLRGHGKIQNHLKAICTRYCYCKHKIPLE